MSYAAQAWVNEHAPYAGGVCRAVLKELADAMSKDCDVAWQSVRRLAHSAGYSRRAVIYGLKTMLEDGVIERASVGNGRGIRAGYRIVRDKTRWTLSRSTLAQALARAAEDRAIEEAKKNGAKFAPLRDYKRVQPLHPLSAERVQSTTQKGATDDTLAPSHPLYEPVDIRSGSDESQGPAKQEPERQQRDPRLGALLRDLMAKMDRKARSGV